MLPHFGIRSYFKTPKEGVPKTTFWHTLYICKKNNQRLKQVFAYITAESLTFKLYLIYKLIAIS